GAFKVVPLGPAYVGGPESIRIGPSVITGLPEATISPLLQHSRCRPNKGRSKRQQQPQTNSGPTAITTETRRARIMRWVPLSGAARTGLETFSREGPGT